MSEIAPRQTVDDLVLANHILSNEGVLDAFGHVSVRHPTARDRLLISRTRAPELASTSSGARVREMRSRSLAVGCRTLT